MSNEVLKFLYEQPFFKVISLLTELGVRNIDQVISEVVAYGKLHN